MNLKVSISIRDLERIIEWGNAFSCLSDDDRKFLTVLKGIKKELTKN